MYSYYFENEMCSIDEKQSIDLFMVWLMSCFFVLTCTMLTKMWLLFSHQTFTLNSKKYEDEPLIQEMKVFFTQLNPSKIAVKDQFLQANILANRFKMKVYHKLLVQ